MRERIFGVFAALIMIAVSAVVASADVFYTVSNYSTGSAGMITGTGAGAKITKDVITNLGRDAFGFSFKRADGAPMCMVREYNYGPNDGIYIYERTGDAKLKLVKNTTGWTPNIHGAASSGKYLYLASYEQKESDSSAGEIVRVDMDTWAVDVRKPRETQTVNGHVCTPHGEGILEYGGNIYAIWGMSYNGVKEYEAGEVWKMTKDLDLVSGANKAPVGKNVGNLSGGSSTIYGGKLYVGAIGGYQGPGTWGTIHAVDLDTMESQPVLDGKDVKDWSAVAEDGAGCGVYGIAIAGDGTMFMLLGGYGPKQQTFYAVLYRLRVEDLGDQSKWKTVETFRDAGYTWSAEWDDDSQCLWLCSGRSLQMYDKDGTKIKTFPPSQLGDNIYSISVVGRVATGPAPTPVPDVGGESSGGGGCETGAFAMAMAAVLAAAFRKRR